MHIKVQVRQTFEAMMLLERAYMKQTCSQWSREPYVVRASLLKPVIKRAASIVWHRVRGQLGTRAAMRWCVREMARRTLTGYTAKTTPGASRTSNVLRRSPALLQTSGHMLRKRYVDILFYEFCVRVELQFRFCRP